MTHIAWLESRTPASPEALVQRIREVFGAHPEFATRHRVDAFVDAGEVLLRRVLAAGTDARASALDLLAADACVTYAFEAAADEPATLGARAEAAMMKIAEVAGEAGDRTSIVAGEVRDRTSMAAKGVI